MMADKLVRLSKRLSYILRHHPESVGLVLDGEGWVDVDRILDALKRGGRALTRGELEEVVRKNDKKRFSFSEDGRRIRANQGHSVGVDLGLEPVEPPDLLYHGTVGGFLDSIRREGLKKRSRQHVHLSPDVETALKVGGRRGRPVVLVVEARRMHTGGHRFYISANGVWLTDAVPPEYLRFPDDSGAR